MTDHKCLPVLLVVNICVVLCASLPLSYKQTAETENVFNKLFPGDRRSMHEDWSRDERSMFQPLGERRSRFQSNRVSEMSLREKLLRDVLDWEKRRLEKAKLDQSTTEKRGQLRCTSGYMAQWCNNGDTSTEQTERKREEWAFKEPGHAQMDEMDIDKVNEYDMELEKALRKRFEMKEPSNLHNQM